MLKNTFSSLLGSNTRNDQLIEAMWADLKFHYSESSRHYHNLSHLENLMHELLAVKSLITDWDTVLFTLYYHDIIYDVKSKTNEEDSADYAEKVMKALHIRTQQIKECRQQIIATKLHEQQTDLDTNLFTDADLSILGAEENRYTEYAKQIRKEYSIYPDELYFPGRKNVLLHFLNMKSIFKTNYFYDKYEVQAKYNLLKEIQSLE